MAVAWAALGLLALVSFSFIGIVWNKIDKLGSDLRQEIGRLDGKIDQLGSELRSELRQEIGQVRQEISQVRQEIGRLDGKIDKLGSDLGQEIMAQSIRIDGLAVAEGQHPANA